jgi:hypothetical protein
MDFDYSTETITPELTNLLTIGGTGALEVPIGITSERPVTGLANGALRYNTTLSVLEGYINSSWYTVTTAGTSTPLVLSGDVSGTGTTSAVTTTLATVNGNVGTFASVTVNGKGLVTAAAALSGDATTSGSVLTFATVNGNVGQFTALTVNGKGLVTAATNLAATGDATGTASGAGIALTLATVNGSPQTDTFRKITVNGKGLVTATSAVTSSDITTALGFTPVNRAGDTMTGILNAGGFVISNVGTPVAGTDATNKNYVDAAVSGLSWKQAVRAATTVNGTLATAFANGQTIDGVTLATGDRILIKNQTTQTENGIYIVAASGTPTRSTDADTGAELVGATVYVDQGTANADTGWTQTTNAPITIGTSNIVWAQFSGSGAYTAGTGLTLTGNQFSLTSPVVATLGGTGTTTAPTSGQFLYSSGGTTYAPTTLTTVAVTTFAGGTTGLTPAAATSGAITLAGTLVAVNGGTGQSVYAVGDILYASTTTALSRLADVAAGSYLRSGGVNTAPVWSTTTLPNSATTGDILFASAANTYTNLADVATGNVVISGGVGTAPSYGKVGLTTHVSGTLPIANGGTNSATALSGSSIMVSNGTSIIQGAAGTTTTVLHGNAAGTPTYGAVSLTADVSGILPLANGGSNANLTAVNGGIVYSTATAMAITAAGTSGQVLTSSGAGAPTWTSTSGLLQLYKENPSSPTAPSATGTNAVAILSGSAASGTNAIAIGAGTSANVANIFAYANGNFATAGDSQNIRTMCRNSTTDATATQLFVDGSSQRLVLPNNSAWTCIIRVVGRRTDATGGNAMYSFLAGVTRDATAATTTLQNSSRTIINESSGSLNCTIAADTTNGSLNITVTGIAAQTWRWVATVEITQVTN